MKSRIRSCPERICDFIGQGGLSRLVGGAAGTKLRKKKEKKNNK
jgi:hypothetical protein